MPSAPPLQWNARLAEAAQAHSDHMDRWNRFNHKGLWGSQPGSRAQRAGYQWRTVGENIAKGQRSVTEVVRSWRNSPGHCRNLMNAGFTEMGAATSGPYWTQVLAAPR